MKSFNKFLAIFCSIILFIGIILCVIGVVMGGRYEFIFGDYEAQQISGKFEKVKELDIDLNYGDIKIKSGDELKIEGNMPKKVNFKAEVENGKLKISDEKVFWNFFMGFDWGRKGDITIYLPKDVELSKCDIDIGACKVEADEIKTEKLNLSVGAGNCKISNLVTDECKLEIGAGNLEVDADVKEKIKIDCGVGNADLTIMGSKDDFDYSVESGIGDVRIAGKTYSGIGVDKDIDNNSDKKIDVECGVGNVEINFKGE